MAHDDNALHRAGQSGTPAHVPSGRERRLDAGTWPAGSSRTTDDQNHLSQVAVIVPGRCLSGTQVTVSCECDAAWKLNGFAGGFQPWLLRGSVTWPQPHETGDRQDHQDAHHRREDPFHRRARRTRRAVRVCEDRGRVHSPYLTPLPTPPRTQPPVRQPCGIRGPRLGLHRLLPRRALPVRVPATTRRAPARRRLR